MTARRTGWLVFRGQRQKWFAMRFAGDEREITSRSRPTIAGGILRMALGAADRVPGLVVPFRREVYRAVAREFARSTQYRKDINEKISHADSVPIRRPCGQAADAARSCIPRIV